MRQPMTPGRDRWLSLIGAALTFAFGAVFAALALWGFPPASMRGGGGVDAGLGARIMFGSVAALAMFATFYLAATGLRGRAPDADDERGRVSQHWSVAEGGSVTVYRQAIRRGLVNLAAAVAGSLLVIGFTVGGVLISHVGFVLIAGLMGLLIVPFTIKGLVQFVTDPVVLELGRSGIRIRGHRFVPWADVRALRIEEYGTGSRRRVGRDPRTRSRTRRLGVALHHDPGGFSLVSAMTGGAYSRIGVTEVELPVTIEEVIEQARALHPELVVEGTPMPSPASATAVTAAPERPAFGPERADAEAVRWQGATIVPALVRRRLRDVALSLPAQLSSLVGLAVMLTVTGADEVLPVVLGVYAFFLIGIQVVISGVGTVRAARAAARRRYTLTESFLVTESGEHRHERRLASLPPLVLSMERNGVGTISYELPQPAIPDWVRRLAPIPQRQRNVLLESIPDAARVFELLRAAVPAPAPPGGAVAEGTVTAQGVASAAPAGEPMLLPAQPWTVKRFGAWIPWWFGLPFLLIGLFSLVVTTSAPAPGPWYVPVLLEGLFAAVGGWIVWSNISTALTRRRLATSGTVVMARVIGLADANAQVNDVNQWTVRYEYDAGGRTHTGDSPMMSPDEAMGWAEGDRVSIAYDPEHPNVSLWLGGGSAQES